MSRALLHKSYNRSKNNGKEGPVLDRKRLNTFVSMQGENASNGFVDILSPVRTTDLDKASYGSRRLYQNDKKYAESNNDYVLSERDMLEQFGQNIPAHYLPLLFPVRKPPVNTNDHGITCNPMEIKPKKSVLRNTFALPMQFSSGYFRDIPVSLRKGCPRDPMSVVLIEEGMERDYNILRKVKHPNVILLMAASLHRETLEHMTLVMETVDYTLNYFLHQMDSTLSVVQSVTVAQQIASAALYLQKCGYIHSNISSHNVLVRENPWRVKLSSFELTTEVDFAATQKEILTKYCHHNLSSLNSQCDDTSEYVAVEEEANSLRDQYMKMSKLMPTLKCCTTTKHKYLSMASKHVIYDTNYRQHLSLHNFQAPELLTTKKQFVFPTPKTDVYSLCLLLWELLNKCIPFVVYNKMDMERMIQANKLSLPFFEEEKCEPFMDILKIGLAPVPQNRTFGAQGLITMLEYIKSRIRSDMAHLYKEPHVPRSDAVQEVNLHASPVAKAEPINGSLSKTSILNTGFNQHLPKKNEITSSRKRYSKSPQKYSKIKSYRQLFKDSKEAINSGEYENISFNSEVNREIDALASAIQSEQMLKGTKEDIESNFNSIVAALSYDESDNPSKIAHNENSECSEVSPEIVDNQHQSAINSCSNLFVASTSEPRERYFLSNISASLDNACPNVEECSLPNTPVANAKEIRHNAWLSNKSLNVSANDVDEQETEKRDQSPRLNDSNQLNVSIRIVRNKVTPTTIDNSLVMSKIQHFDSNTSNGKIINNRRVDYIDTNYSANYPMKDSVSKELVEVDITPRNHLPGNTEHPGMLQSNCSTSQTLQKECGDSRTLSSKVGRPVVCSESEGSDDADANTNIITSKWPSVRNRIFQFEKCCELTTKPSPLLKTAMKYVQKISEYVTGTQSKDVRLTEAPTLTIPTAYSEHCNIVPDVGLAEEMTILNQVHEAAEKSTTEITSNMSETRRTSMDLDEVDRPKIVGMTLAHNAISGGRKRFVVPFESASDRSFNASNITNHSLSSPMTKSQGTPQTTRSIEDLYIDDDFDQGLGANIELHSESSDFLNLDII